MILPSPNVAANLVLIKLSFVGRIESESDLEKLIISRQENRKKQMDSFLDNLEAKYAKKPKQKNAQKGKKKK